MGPGWAVGNRRTLRAHIPNNLLLGFLVIVAVAQVYGKYLSYSRNCSNPPTNPLMTPKCLIGYIIYPPLRSLDYSSNAHRVLGP